MNMLALALIPVCAVLWRFAGGGWFAAKLPGRPIFYVAALLAAPLALYSWQTAVLAALLCLGPAFLPHGRWYGLGNAPLPPRPPSAFERAVEHIVPTIHARLFTTLAIGFLPACAFLTTSHPLLALALVVALPAVALLAYVWAWSTWDGTIHPPTPLAEYVIGAEVGAVLALTFIV